MNIINKKELFIMKFSDKDLRAATQVAYMDFDEFDVMLHPDWTIKEHFANNDTLDAHWRSHDKELYDEITNGVYGSWKIADYRNHNKRTGFVACLIDTGGGSAIVAFRGSESFDFRQIWNDWILSDAGLVNSAETAQQRESESYIEYINGKFGRSYDSFSLTGHSLGGNLAEHAAITAPDEFYTKINRVLNLDGPGYSGEYIEAHKNDIKKHSAKIDHYQYSWVGAILKSLPGTNYRNMSASDEGGHILKHDTKYILYDKNGNMIPGEPDKLSVHTNGFTNSLDDFSTSKGILSAADLFSIFTHPRSAKSFLADRNAYRSKYTNNAQKNRYFFVFSIA